MPTHVRVQYRLPMLLRRRKKDEAPVPRTRETTVSRALLVSLFSHGATNEFFVDLSAASRTLIARVLIVPRDEWRNTEEEREEQSIVPRESCLHFWIARHKYNGGRDSARDPSPRCVTRESTPETDVALSIGARKPPRNFAYSCSTSGTNIYWFVDPLTLRLQRVCVLYVRLCMRNCAARCLRT